MRLSSLLPLLLLAAQARAADLHLQILDGRTGQPIVYTHVVILGDGSPALFTKFTTDNTGSLVLDPQHASALRIFVESRAPCAPHPSPAFSVADAHTSGLVSHNSCSSTVTAKPVPGSLTLFVRPQTLAEKTED